MYTQPRGWLVITPVPEESGAYPYPKHEIYIEITQRLLDIKFVLMSNMKHNNNILTVPYSFAYMSLKDTTKQIYNSLLLILYT